MAGLRGIGYDPPTMAAVSEASDTSIVELGVPEAHRTMSIEKVFWSHFSPNFSAPTWMIGLLLAAAGLDRWWGVLAIVAGSVLGVLPTAFSALMGPATGLTQIENSRFSFGRRGTRLPAAINYVMCVGWVAVGNVPATLALMAALAFGGIALPFWLALAIVAGVELVASVYGHHAVQLLQKYVGYGLVVAFGIIVVVATLKGAIVGAPAQHGSSLATFALGVSIAASNTLSWAPYSSDYTRYAPKTTAPATIFLLVFVGLAGSSTAMEIFGFVTATGITDTTPAGFIAGVAKLSGTLAPLVLGVIAVAAICGSTINITTASYSLISSGVKIPRPVSAIVAGLIAYVLAVAGEGGFTSLYTNYLILLLYWISPWIGIVLADWFFVPRGSSDTSGWRAGATIFAIVTPVTILLFSSTDAYTGPIAKMLGGLDVGYVVGFFGAAIAYVATVRSARAGAESSARPTPA
jgi:NCS1 family nucleobase:cation symporter-1